jgi:hypothetical protein
LHADAHKRAPVNSGLSVIALRLSLALELVALLAAVCAFAFSGHGMHQ